MDAVLWFILLSAGFCGAAMAGCPPTTVVSSLDLNKLMGRWYEHASLGTLFLFGLDRCKVTTFSQDSDDQTITMLNSRIPYLRSSQVSTTWTAAAKSSNPDGHLTLNLKLPIIGTIEVPLMVVDTDYDNYLVLNLCRNIGFFNFNAGYILMRKRSYSTQDLNKMYVSIDAALMQNKLQRSNFVLSNNKNCPADAAQQIASSSLTDISTLSDTKVAEETASTSSDGATVQLVSVGEEPTMGVTNTDSGKSEQTALISTETTEVQLQSGDKELTNGKKTDSYNTDELKEKVTSTSGGETTVVSESVDKTVGVDATSAKSPDSTVLPLSENAAGHESIASNTQVKLEDTPATA